MVPTPDGTPTINPEFELAVTMLAVAVVLNSKKPREIHAKVTRIPLIVLLHLFIVERINQDEA